MERQTGLIPRIFWNDLYYNVTINLKNPKLKTARVAHNELTSVMTFAAPEEGMMLAFAFRPLNQSSLHVPYTTICCYYFGYSCHWTLPNAY